MSSIIVQMLPNFTLEPAPMGAAAARPQGFVPQCWCKRKSLGALKFKLCPREMCIPVKLGVCSILAFPCFLLVLSQGCGARSLSFLTLPLHTLPGPNPPMGPGAPPRDPGAGLGQAGQGRWGWKCSRTRSNRFGALHCQGCSELPDLQQCFPEGAASRAGLFISSPSSGQAELLLPLQWSQMLLVLCVFKSISLKEMSELTCVVPRIPAILVLQAFPPSVQFATFSWECFGVQKDSCFFPTVAINRAQTLSDIVGRNIYRKMRNQLNWRRLLSGFTFTLSTRLTDLRPRIPKNKHPPTFFSSSLYIANPGQY